MHLQIERFEEVTKLLGCVVEKRCRQVGDAEEQRLDVLWLLMCLSGLGDQFPDPCRQTLLLDAQLVDPATGAHCDRVIAALGDLDLLPSPLDPTLQERVRCAQLLDLAFEVTRRCLAIGSKFSLEVRKPLLAKDSASEEVEDGLPGSAPP